MQLEYILSGMKTTADYAIKELSKTRPQEIVIVAMLAVSIGIGIAILVQLKKLKDRL